MQITLREKIFWWLCDYWWILLSTFMFALAAYFTRVYWLPLVGLESTPIANSTPESGPIAEFVDADGKYSFSHPTNWIMEDVGNQSQQWILPNGVTMSVHSEAALSSDTLESYAQEVIARLPYSVLRQSAVTIGGRPSIRQEVAYPGESTRVALGYLIIYNEIKFQIALSGLEEIPASEQEKFIREFEKAMATFQIK